MSARAPSRWKTIALWSLPVLLLLGVGGIFVARAAIDSYLKSDRFRQFLAQKTTGTLRAETELDPVHFDGNRLYTNAVTAQGTTEASFSKLEMEGLRAELNWSRILQRVWQVDSVEVQKLRVGLGGPRLPAPVKVEADPAPAKNGGLSWLPNRVEVARGVIRDAGLTWSEGGLNGTSVSFEPAEGGWNIEGSGGSITHGKLPQLDVERLKLRYKEPALFVQNAEFRQSGGGTMTATGEVDFDRKVDLRVMLNQVSLTPWLAGDWKLRLRGDASGELTIRSALPLSGPPEIAGTLELSRGQLEALPVLNQIAAFTRTQQFRRLALSKASGRFTQRGQRLEVQDFIVESERLMRVEGSFVVENSLIEGNFLVGVNPSTLQWLPGSQARVFTETRGAYVWAPMRLTGPLDAPREDLSGRLATAAGEALLDTATSTADDAAKKLQDAAKSAIDLLFGPAK